MSQIKEAGRASAKRKGRGLGNVIDVIILILLLASVVGIGLRIYLSSNPTVSDRSEEYEVLFRIENVSFTLPAYFVEGETVRMESGEVFGTLLNESDSGTSSPLNVTVATVLVQDDSGAYVEVPYPDGSVVNANGALLVHGFRTEDESFLLGGVTHITPGDTYHVCTEKVDFTLTVTEIRKH